MARRTQDQPALPSDPVLARSLLSFTTLASNPPNYPRNPTQERREPLVLYIVRVPGSKDVFLSPLKPPTKSSISPDSINSSLYFCHVAGPGDDVLLEDIENERKVSQEKQTVGDNGCEKEDESGKKGMLAMLNRVQRKPVPSTAPDTPTAKAPSPTLPLSNGAEFLLPKGAVDKESAQTQTSTGTHPRNGTKSAGESRTSRLWDSPTLLRRPVAHEQDTSEANERHTRKWMPRGTSPVRETFHRLRSSLDITPGRPNWDAARPIFKPKAIGKDRLGGLINFTAEPGTNPLFQKTRRSDEGPQEISPPSPFHITLIRRDPTYGNQWNVGTITNCAAPSEATSDGSMTIEITTPGYKKLADNRPISFEDFGISDPTSNSKPKPVTKPTNPRSGPLKFMRTLTPVNYPISYEPIEFSPQRRKAYPVKLRGNYAFTSPWNGTCTFGPGVNCRTIRCRHVIPSPNTSFSSSSSSSTSSAVTVAEIRFNLPTFPSTSPRPSSAQHAGEVNSPKPNSDPISYPLDEDRLDLSLARERAGGGMRGNCAKLGKLIIEDEGQKMVDLLVAACMGVFWGIYEVSNNAMNT
ncbi:hypothetical protein LOZ12_000749 [Ophidiomyces ophidiicola]|nr:hypothetical protein LOZ62_001623 [Ophidiomyces ophidiicola]KAI2033036.1 hypothetical protein LOZ45_000896 [Ophidiomyces ophidiicola]KAI2056585.1 hypothetical protein LOZ38_000065 [Ophidiomyces ophidiicola]KAI2060447.1 hypothetical protein LOZ44_000069 [Ophidiomyces ophidiicola]KAI2081427.1 hypothetical protein LOZ37_001238 [Ophidiomyces ophidiicola]